MSAAFWICAAITAISAAVSLGYSIAAARAPEHPGSSSPLYAAARSLALAVVAVLALVVRSTGWLEAVAVAMIIVQAADAVIGIRIKDRIKTIGPALTAAANLVALINLLR